MEVTYTAALPPNDALATVEDVVGTATWNLAQTSTTIRIESPKPLTTDRTKVGKRCLPSADTFRFLFSIIPYSVKHDSDLITAALTSTPYVRCSAVFLLNVLYTGQVQGKTRIPSGNNKSHS